MDCNWNRIRLISKAELYNRICVQRCYCRCRYCRRRCCQPMRLKSNVTMHIRYMEVCLLYAHVHTYLKQRWKGEREMQSWKKKSFCYIQWNVRALIVIIINFCMAWHNSVIAWIISGFVIQMTSNMMTAYNRSTQLKAHAYFCALYDKSEKKITRILLPNHIILYDMIEPYNTFVCMKDCTIWPI